VIRRGVAGVEVIREKVRHARGEKQRECGAHLRVALPGGSDGEHDEHQPVEERADQGDGVRLGSRLCRRGSEYEVESQHEAGHDRQTQVGDESRVGFLISRAVGEREEGGEREQVLEDFQPVDPCGDRGVADSEEERPGGSADPEGQVGADQQAPAKPGAVVERTDARVPPARPGESQA